MQIARRSLLVAASLAAAPRAAWAQNLSAGAFTHGVASGDPLPDGVILWTRFVGGDGRIAWEIAEDEAFTRIAQRGEAAALGANDFCVKVDARGLAPDRWYFYRFLSASGPSATGRTRTAPLVGAESLTVGLFSCSNFRWGYFHAYRHAVTRDDIDLVLHCGDYIYEYGANDYPNAADAAPGRLIEPTTEIVTLANYYARYAFYHTDPDLLELRRLKPISVVWDDHEIANDSAREGAQNHQANEGLYVDRVAAAAKAYFDWMPIRPQTSSGIQVYRSIDWGDLARIVLLDTRIIGRDRQLDYRSALGMRLLLDAAITPAAVAEFRRSQLEAPGRTLLGAAQETWFADTLAESKQRGQTWQIVTQQVVVGQQLVGATAPSMLPQNVHGNTRRFVQVAARLGELGLPWNLDAWDGYPAARARLLESCAANASNAVILGGDSHNTWLNNLRAANGSRLAAVEYAGASVTSPGLERTLSNAAPGARESFMRASNPELAWCDVSRRGYAILRFTRVACESEWIAFDDVSSSETQAPTISRATSTPSATAGPGAWAVAS